MTITKDTYIDDKWNVVVPEAATAIIRHEYDENGKLIQETIFRKDSETKEASSDDCIFRWINGHVVCLKDHGDYNPHDQSPRISYDTAKNNFNKWHEETRRKYYTYDPVTNKSYSARKQDEMKDIYNQFGDKRNNVYVIATTNHRGMLDSRLATQYKNIQSDGSRAFIGGWTDKQGVKFTDVSFARDHGLSLDTALSLKARYKQQSIMMIKPNGRVKFI